MLHAQQSRCFRAVKLALPFAWFGALAFFATFLLIFLQRKGHSLLDRAYYGVLAHESPGLQLAFLLPARTPAVRRVASSFASRKFLSVCVSASVACTEHANGFLQSSVACKYCCVSSFCCQSQQPGTLPGIAPGVVPFASEAKQTTLGNMLEALQQLVVLSGGQMLLQRLSI